MKRVFLFFLVGALLSGCATSTKMLQKGQYDAAIERSVMKLRKKPTNTKEIQVLERAYSLANEQNLERIRFIQREGNPRNMPELVALYNRLKQRQSLVRTVTPLNLNGRMLEFPYVDYDEQIIAAQRGAASFLYEEAQRLMATNEKEAYRQAWNHLNTVMQYSSDYPQAAELAAEAREKGISRALVSVNNRTHLNLPQEFVQKMLTVDPRGIESPWVEFYYKDLDERIPFDYYLVVNLNLIDVSPDRVSEKDRMFRKKVEDGFDYLLDARGNVVKDSLGNDIKIPRYKDLACTLIETLQQKGVIIEGELEIISDNPRRLLKKEPLRAVGAFEHSSARAVGDVAALDDDARKLLNSRPAPFPNDADMIIRASDAFRQAIASGIRRNRNFIR